MALVVRFLSAAVVALVLMIGSGQSASAQYVVPAYYAPPVVSTYYAPAIGYPVMQSSYYYPAPAVAYSYPVRPVVAYSPIFPRFAAPAYVPAPGVTTTYYGPFGRLRAVSSYYP